MILLFNRHRTFNNDLTVMALVLIRMSFTSSKTLAVLPSSLTKMMMRGER